MVDWRGRWIDEDDEYDDDDEEDDDEDRQMEDFDPVNLFLSIRWCLLTDLQRMR